MLKKIASLMLGLTLIVVFSVPSFVGAQSVDDIKFMTENYPPFNYSDNGKLQGISVDLIVAMLEKMNVKQSRDNIALVPWARGYQTALKKKDTCIFATTRTEEREKLFKWVGPISSTTISLVAKKEKNIKISSVEDIKAFSVGAVINDIGQELLVNAGIDSKKLDLLGGINVIQQSIQKLNANRIDLFSYEENVFKWELKKNGFNLDDYVTVYTLKKGELYYAFNIETPDPLIQQFQSVLDELRQDGTHQKILDVYLN